jgi:hypothetical protein
MNFSYSYVYGEDTMEGLIATLLFYAIYFVFAGGLSIALYVFRSLGVYTIAKRRGLNNSWFAWIPVVDQYLLGSLSDQYQYVVKGKNKSKRKWLLGLNIGFAVTYVAMLAVTVGMVVQLASSAMAGYGEMQLSRMAMRSVGTIVIIAIPMVLLSIVLTVIRFVALHDVYVSLDPRNSTMYTVLSILFQVTEPFFLFFNRKKDDGMPPRRDAQPVDAPVWEAPKAEEPWVNE